MLAAVFCQDAKQTQIMYQLQKVLSRAEKAQELINLFGYDEYCKLAYERFNFPFMWGISQTGEIIFDENCILDYLESELAKGLSGDEIIERDKKIQDDAMDIWYEEMLPLLNRIALSSNGS